MAGDGAVTVTEVAGLATAETGLSHKPNKDATMICKGRKRMGTPFVAEAHASATNGSFFGSSAIRHCAGLTRGFASPPHGGFAIVEKSLRW